MTKDEALRLALEALEDLIEAGAEDWSEQRPCVRIGREVATAIKAALAQPEQNLSCKSTQSRLAASWGYVKVQPEQEPVAWRSDCGYVHINKHEDDDEPLYTSPPKRQPDPYDQTALELCDQCGWKAVIPGEPCFMCVKQRQPLTAEQINDIERDGEFWDDHSPLDFARAIEQAHGIGDKT